jgi:hypothetical protein
LAVEKRPGVQDNRTARFIIVVIAWSLSPQKAASNHRKLLKAASDKRPDCKGLPQVTATRDKSRK